MKSVANSILVNAWFFIQRHSMVFLFIGGILSLHLGIYEIAQAQTGDEVFGNSACNLLTQVLTKKYGAMITVLSGVLAIAAAVMGSFKGAWSLLFVSVGCVIAEELVQVLFPNLSCS